MATLAVIIARAGSKGLHDKSMQPLLGKPVIAWTLEHALGCRRVDHVALSSDCPLVLATGRDYGVCCYRRPPERASDTTTIDDGVRHGVECWEEEHGTSCDCVAILYGNVPVRPLNLSDQALDKLITTGADSVQSVCPVGKMHPFWMKKLVGPYSDQLEVYQPNRIYRRQDLPPLYMLDAGILAMTRDSLFTVDPAEPHAFLGRDRLAITTRPGDVVDIDDELDLALAAVLLERRISGTPPLRQRWAG